MFSITGKQFRVVIMSTVRTKHTCALNADENNKHLDLGFMSNVRMLNTVITRARSLVITVGDPVSLSVIGECRFSLFLIFARIIRYSISYKISF